MIMKGKLIKLYLNSDPKKFPQSRQYQLHTQELSLGCPLAATRVFLQGLNGDILYELVKEGKKRPRAQKREVNSSGGQ